MSIVVRRSAIPVSLTVLATVVGILFVVQPDTVASLWSGYLVEVQAIQRGLHRQLAAAMRMVQVEGAGSGLGARCLKLSLWRLPCGWSWPRQGSDLDLHPDAREQVTARAPAFAQRQGAFHHPSAR